MAHCRLGNRDEATRWLSKAVEWTDRVLKEHDADNGKKVSWQRRATLKLFRTEAEALLKGASESKGPKPQQKEQPKTATQHS
jgi:hypothetical protein